MCLQTQLAMSDQPPFSDFSSILGWTLSPPLLPPFGFDDESFPAGIDPLNDEQSAFNAPWRSSVTHIPLAGSAAGDAAPASETSVSGRTAFGGGAAYMPPAAAAAAAPLVASTPRSRLFADAALSVEAAQKIASLEFDDFVFRSWQESATPLPPLHVAGNQLRLALFPGYIDIRPIDIRPTDIRPVPTAI
jgi:hypothetical protein